MTRLSRAPCLSRALCLFAAAGLLLTAAPSFAAPDQVASVDKPVSISEKKGRIAALGEMATHKLKYEDTLVQVARDYNVGFVELRSANPGVDPWIPADDRKELVIPGLHIIPDVARKGVVINLAEMRIYLFTKPGSPKTFPIGIGREGLLTPHGSTTVVRKKDGPTWTPTPRMRQEDPNLPAVVPPGPENPMGTHALYLGWPTYAIHGTNRAFGIGRRVSSGCIRMYPEDIVQVFNLVPVGTEVTVIDQPIKAAWIGDKFYIEAQPGVDYVDMVENEGGLPPYHLSEQDMAIILKAAGDDADRLDWEAVRQIVRERKGYPIPVGDRHAVVEQHEGSGAARDNAPT